MLVTILEEPELGLSFIGSTPSSERILFIFCAESPMCIAIVTHFRVHLFIFYCLLITNE